jgi:hypothetical protein
MVFRKNAVERLKKIHMLSQSVNRGNHRKKLLELVKKHVHEIEQLYKISSPHADIETGDLAILCFELILESKKNPDEIIQQCFERYEKKLRSIKNGL